MSDAREQSLAEDDFVRWPLQFQSIGLNSLLPEDVRQLSPMICLQVLRRPPSGGLVGPHHHARRVDDVLDRGPRPDVGRARGAQPRSSSSST